MEYKNTLIRSIRDYLDWLDDATISTVKSDTGDDIIFENPNLYYRGQSCVKELNPGIFRDSYSPGVVEHQMLLKASLYLWKELSVFKTYLEKLVFLQHYGMPTRLLDVTFNPLVALYFACNKQNNSEGIVFCGSRQSEESEHIAELTSEFVFKHPFDFFEKDVKRFVIDKEESLYKFSQPLFVLPPINNPRVEHQNGAFVMAPLAKIGKDIVYLNTNSLDDSGFFSDKRALIPDTCKFAIIKDLHKFGINRGNIFQGVSEKIESIIQEEKWGLERYNLNIGGEQNESI